MRHQVHDLIAPVPGTARQIHSFHFGPEHAEGKVYIQSSLHADERPGMLVAWHVKVRLAELAAAGRLRSEIVLVPIANPVGLEQVLMDIPLGRYELESGQNFNRLFVDLSDTVGDQVEGSLGDNPQQNVELIRAALSAALAGQTAATQLHSQRLVLQRLEAPDRFSELLADAQIVECDLLRFFHHAKQFGGNRHQREIVERIHRIPRRLTRWSKVGRRIFEAER